MTTTSLYIYGTFTIYIVNVKMSCTCLKTEKFREVYMVSEVYLSVKVSFSMIMQQIQALLSVCPENAGLSNSV